MENYFLVEQPGGGKWNYISPLVLDSLLRQPSSLPKQSSLPLNIGMYEYLNTSIAFINMEMCW